MASKDDPPADTIGGAASSASPPPPPPRLPASTHPPSRRIIFRLPASSTSRPPGLSASTQNPSKDDPLKADVIGGSAAKADVVAAAAEDAVAGAAVKDGAVAATPVKEDDLLKADVLGGSAVKDAVTVAAVKEDALAAAAVDLVGAVDLVVAADPKSKDMTRRKYGNSANQDDSDANEIQKLIALPSIQQGDFSLKYHDIHVVKNMLHIAAWGVYKFHKSYCFTQWLVVHRERMLILSDILVNVLDVSALSECSTSQATQQKTDTVVGKLEVSALPKFRLSVKASATKATDTVVGKQKDVAESSFEVLLVYNKQCLEHAPPGPHAENPDRIKNIVDRLRAEGILERVSVQTSDPAEPKDVLSVHSEDLVSFVDSLPMTAEQFKLCPYISKLGHDMYFSAGSREAVYYAAGAVIKACDAVFKDNYNKAFALVRPPGHHASSAFSEGYCYYNNVAIAVKHLQEDLGIENVAAVDIDTHHGNGSQSIFFDDKTVLFFSTHCKDLDYPPKKYANIKKLSRKHTAIGEGTGIGYNVNVPMNAGFKDADILYSLDEVLVPLLRAFKPGAIVVSAGFDAAMGEELGGELSRKCYGTIADKLVEEGGGKLILCLEGGYKPDILPSCVSHVVRALLGDKDACLSEEEIQSLPHPSQDTQDTIRKIKKLLRKHWNIEGW